MYSKSLLIAVVCVLTTQLSFAQDCVYSLRGTVIDYHDKTLLAGATVNILGTNLSAMTDIDGQYIIKGLCNDTIELEVSHPECRTQIIPIRIDGDTTLDIKLEHHLEELDEVKVVGNYIADKTNSAQEKKLDINTLETYSSASLGDALKKLGGVSSLNTGANIVKPAIHGLNGSRVLVLNDGVRMQDMEWGSEHAPNIDINSAGSVSVIKGASALQYGGDAIGGTIIMDQANIPLKDTIYGKTMVSGVSNGKGGNLVSELTKAYENGWFIKGQASYKRLGDHEAPDYVLSNTGVQEIAASLQLGRHQFAWGWDARYSYFDTEIAILRSSHIGNVDDLIRSINSGEPEIIRDFTYELLNPRQKVTHHLGKLKLYKRFSGVGKWNMQYDFQSNKRYEYDIRRGDRDNIPSIDLQLTTHTLSSDFKWDANPNWNIHVGLLGRYQDNFANPDTGVRRLIPDYEKYDIGSFFIGEYHINNQYMLDAGVRYDFSRIDALKYYQTSRWEERGYDDDFEDLIVDDLGTQLLTNPIFDYHNVSATIGGRFHFKDYSELKINYAMAQRAPNPSELFSDGLHHSAARIELGDLRLKSETSHKISTSYEKDFDMWGIAVETYANWIHNFIVLEPTGVEYTLRGSFPVWEYRQTNARLLGFDISAYVNWTDHWKSDHKVSLVKGKDVTNDGALINIAPVNFRNTLTFSMPKWKNFEAYLESQYVFRQNETPDNIMVYSPEQDDDVLLEINTAPDAYHLFALGSKMEFPFKNRTKLTTSLTVNNLLNTSYRDYLNRQRYFADELGRNIILQLKFNY